MDSNACVQKKKRRPLQLEIAVRRPSPRAHEESMHAWTLLLHTRTKRGGGQKRGLTWSKSRWVSPLVSLFSMEFNLASIGSNLTSIEPKSEPKLKSDLSRSQGLQYLLEYSPANMI